MNIAKRTLRYIKIQYNPILKEKARVQQKKIAFVNNNDNLPPDTYILKKLNLMPLCYPQKYRTGFRKYIVDDEIRNAINLKNNKYGSINIESSSDYLKFAVGWKAEKETEGNLKIWIRKNGIEKIIFDKDTNNLLCGWNENKITVKEKRYTVEWVNTIDEDIYLSISTTPPTKQKKNIIVIILDGVNPDGIGLYRNEPMADNISRFFKHATMYTNAYVQGEWTMPNFVSIATSLYSTRHGVVDPDIYLKSISNEASMLSEIMQQHGYNTMAYFGHNRVSAGFGHARGYNQFYYRCTYDEFSQRNKKEYVNDVRVTDIQRKENTNLDVVINAIRFLRDNQDTNNFLFLHVFDTHRPFFQAVNTISNEYISSMNSNPVNLLACKTMDEKGIKYLQDVHLQKLKEVDDNLSLLFDYISNHERNHTSVVLTSDHGNIFFDDVENILPFDSRDRYLKDPLLKVPYLVNNGGARLIVDAGRIEANLSIMPVVLDFAGIPVPNGIDGTKDGKEYTITESNFEDIYELVLTTDGYIYFMRCKREREMGLIFYNEVMDEHFYESDGKEINPSFERVKEIRNNVSYIMKEKEHLWQ